LDSNQSAGGLLLTVVGCFELGWGDVAEGAMGGVIG
jgi:hypothetical protein